MNATTPAPRQPRPAVRLEDQIQQLQYAPELARTVMNCGDETINAMWSGIPYFLQPGETIEIPARLVHPRNEKTNKPLLRQRPTMEVSKEGFPSGSPATIVAQLLKRYGNMGLVLVVGDGRDDQRQAQARERYVRARLERAMSIQAQWLQEQEKNAKKPGSVPLVMPLRIRSEIQWLREHRAKLEQKRKRYLAFDGYDSDDYDEVVAWVQDTYPEDWAERGEACITDNRKTATPTAGAPEAEPIYDEPEQEALAPPAPAFLRGPGNPFRPTPAPAQAQAAPERPARPRRSGIDPDKLRDQVAAANIELTPEQWDGIDNADPEIVLDVLRMIQESVS